MYRDITYKRAPSGTWPEPVYDVLHNGTKIGSVRRKTANEAGVTFSRWQVFMLDGATVVRPRTFAEGAQSTFMTRDDAAFVLKEHVESPELKMRMNHDAQEAAAEVKRIDGEIAQHQGAISKLKQERKKQIERWGQGSSLRKEEA